MASYPSNDLIYNRFDLIYDEVKSFKYQYKGGNYQIDAHLENDRVILNIWGKVFPQKIFEKCIHDVFECFPEISFIDVTRAGNNYNGWLYNSDNIYIELPKSNDLLMARLSKKHRYNLRREKRLLEEAIGRLSVQVISRDYITSEIVNQYFEWKKITHRCDYDLLPIEYLEKYHVTNAMLVCDGNQRVVGIVFYCKVNNTVYLENFSYEYSLKKYSIGELQYVDFLRLLIKEKCLYCFLGGGKYEYKRHFNSISCATYSGKIYSKSCIDMFNEWFKSKGIHKVALYGIGAVGHAFLAFSKQLNIEVCYGIDENETEDNDLKVYYPQDDLPQVDALFITVMARNIECLKLVREKICRVYYWNELLEMIST